VGFAPFRGHPGGAPSRNAQSGAIPGRADGTGSPGSGPGREGAAADGARRMRGDGRLARRPAPPRSRRALHLPGRWSPWRISERARPPALSDKGQEDRAGCLCIGGPGAGSRVRFGEGKEVWTWLSTAGAARAGDGRVARRVLPPRPRRALHFPERWSPRRIFERGRPPAISDDGGQDRAGCPRIAGPGAGSRVRFGEGKEVWAWLSTAGAARAGGGRVARRVLPPRPRRALHFPERWSP
jgi:hypothetical protein